MTAGVYKQGGKDPDLFKTIRTGIPGTEMPAVRVSDDEVWKLVGFVKRLGSQGLAEKAPGDADAGKAIYAKSGCAGCHRVGTEGSDLGPDLTDIGRRRGLAFLTESIVKPDAFVPNNYRAVQLEMKSGSNVSGHPPERRRPFRAGSRRRRQPALLHERKHKGNSPRQTVADALL